MTLDEAIEALRAEAMPRPPLSDFEHAALAVLAAYDAERAPGCKCSDGRACEGDAKQCEPWCRAGWDDGNLCGPGCVNPKVTP